MGGVIRCEGLSQYSAGADYQECEDAAQGRYRSMCVHEHERIAALCLMHAGRQSWCAACYDLDGHKCALVELQLLEELQP
jgi:hypothetical protein